MGEGSVPRLLVLSPHLDDAALSCGGLITGWPDRERVTVATFFTTAGPEPVLLTRSARSFLHLSGWQGTPAELFAARREEDRTVLAPHARTEHVGLVDGIFRRRALPVPARLAAALPELVHVYPTYRFGVAAGRVSRADRGCLDAVAGWVREHLAEADVVLAPLGVGGHVDHVLVRDAACAAVPADRLGFYADYPYVLDAGPDPSFVGERSLTRVVHGGGAARKRDLVRGYVTQADALYPHGVPEVPDELWWPPDAAGARLLAGLAD